VCGISKKGQWHAISFPSMLLLMPKVICHIVNVPAVAGTVELGTNDPRLCQLLVPPFLMIDAFCHSFQSWNWDISLQAIKSPSNGNSVSLTHPGQCTDRLPVESQSKCETSRWHDGAYNTD